MAPGSISDVLSSEGKVDSVHFGDATEQCTLVVEVGGDVAKERWVGNHGNVFDQLGHEVGPFFQRGPVAIWPALLRSMCLTSFSLPVLDEPVHLVLGRRVVGRVPVLFHGIVTASSAASATIVISVGVLVIVVRRSP